MNLKPQRYLSVRFILSACLLLMACQARNKGARVVAIKDGDTIEVLENGKTTRIRLAEVDSPEKSQPFGMQAKKITSDLCFGKVVQVKPQTTDRYGRTVAIVILPNGKLLNETLVELGAAWHYKAYSKSLVLARLEADARTYKRGLWKLPNPVPPWQFRKQKRSRNTNAPTSAAGSALPAGLVWVCKSKTVKFYHSKANCARLANCKSGIEQLNSAQAFAAGKQKPCAVCVQ